MKTVPICALCDKTLLIVGDHYECPVHGTVGNEHVIPPPPPAATPGKPARSVPRANPAKQAATSTVPADDYHYQPVDPKAKRKWYRDHRREMATDLERLGYKEFLRIWHCSKQLTSHLSRGIPGYQRQSKYPSQRYRRITGKDPPPPPVTDRPIITITETDISGLPQTDYLVWCRILGNAIMRRHAYVSPDTGKPNG